MSDAQPSSAAQAARPAAPAATLRIGEAQSAAVVQALQSLLRLEAAAREARNTTELAHLIANDGRSLVRAGQAFVLAADRLRGPLRVTAVSSVSSLDRNAPLIQVIETVVRQLKSDGREGEPVVYELDPDRAGAYREVAATYPLKQLLWAPFPSRGGTPIGGVMFARDTPWQERERVVAVRVAGATGHSWLALSPRLARRRYGLRRTQLWIAGLVAV